MFALRERRIHVTQEDFEMAVGKVRFLLTALVAIVLVMQVIKLMSKAELPIYGRFGTAFCASC